MLGFHDIFVNSSRILVHSTIQKQDAEQLRDARELNKNRILTDSYGTQNVVLLRNGFADAYDEEDFEATSCSLKNVWNDIVFMTDFEKIFMVCLQAARKKLGMEEDSTPMH